MIDLEERSWSYKNAVDMCDKVKLDISKEVIGKKKCLNIDSIKNKNLIRTLINLHFSWIGYT